MYTDKLRYNEHSRRNETDTIHVVYGRICQIEVRLARPDGIGDLKNRPLSEVRYINVRCVKVHLHGGTAATHLARAT